jgi:hypothetical protein
LSSGARLLPFKGDEAGAARGADDYYRSADDYTPEAATA